MTLEPMYRVDVDGTITELDANASIRDAVGGWIERVQLIESGVDTYGLDLWADEEGLLKVLHPNPVASVLVSIFAGGSSTIVGPVVVAGSRPPETTGCPEGTGVELRRIAAYVVAASDAE